jgi:hypothetical protein
MSERHDAWLQFAAGVTSNGKPFDGHHIGYGIAQIAFYRGWDLGRIAGKDDND